ncbi:GerAB/ArcD/ProY family transporter [Peribacillus simplex]|uniref:GerAB/ArcD/ProY family transporter n=1 Tax=Peribacillus simplex TaxID=1478 RepID=UPI00338E1F04
MGFERIIAKEAGQDAWISVLISGLIINVLLWMCFKLLGRGPKHWIWLPSIKICLVNG